jgi:hypothetical protein
MGSLKNEREATARRSTQCRFRTRDFRKVKLPIGAMMKRELGFTNEESKIKMTKTQREEVM